MFNSPISSRKSVPPLASSIRPALSRAASVNAPRSNPNSSASSNSAGMRRAVHVDERPSPRTPVARVDQPGDQILSGAAFALDENVGAGTRRYLAGALDGPSQRFAGPEQSLVYWARCRSKRRRPHVLVAPLQRSVDGHDEIFRGRRQQDDRRERIDFAQTDRRVFGPIREPDLHGRIPSSGPGARGRSAMPSVEGHATIIASGERVSDGAVDNSIP